MSETGHHPAPVSAIERRVAALEALLTERGLVSEGFIDEVTKKNGRVGKGVRNKV